MITSGFFESVGTDRTYYADSFNNFFEGLIAANGIFENVDEGFGVTPGGNLTLNINSGKAMVNNHWVKNNAVEVIELTAAHNVFNRWDMITLRWDSTTRDVTLNVTTGEAASTENKPEPLRNTTQYEIVLAYIYLPANIAEITAANITDCRYDTELCGVITGLIKQVDTTSIYRQYESKFIALTEQFAAWQTEQQAAYAAWFAALTSELNVNTQLSRTVANHITTREDGTQYVDVPAALNYADGDILDVYVNGVLLIPNTDYELMLNEVENIPMIYIFSDIEKNNVITFICLKNKIGAEV